MIEKTCSNCKHGGYEHPICSTDDAPECSLPDRKLWEPLEERICGDCKHSRPSYACAHVLDCVQPEMARWEKDEPEKLMSPHQVAAEYWTTYLKSKGCDCMLTTGVVREMMILARMAGVTEGDQE